jgi:hypothetical protein
MVHNNLRTEVHNYHETLILIYFTHQSVTYGITESIHIGIMSKLIIVNALVRRILCRHWHVVLFFITFIKFSILVKALPQMKLCSTMHQRMILLCFSIR